LAQCSWTNPWTFCPASDPAEQVHFSAGALADIMDIRNVTSSPSEGSFNSSPAKLNENL
jgi:hypothetical protein